ncbi:MAG: Clp protease ClpS [Planctomycetaceae bacterium]|nr:Clp protease ClpS [Planctomycetaceae bacterium]
MSDATTVDDVEVEEPVVRPKNQQKKDDKSKPKRQPPYAVILHNDEFHTFPYVIELIQKVCGHPLSKAIELTSTVHNNGQAAIWTGAREVAELKRDQIRGFGPDFYASQTVRFPIGVTIEPLPQ